MAYKDSRFFSASTRFYIFGLAAALVFGFFFLTSSFEIPASNVSARQNLTLGRLVFSTVTGSFSGPLFFVRSSNADGSDQITLAGSFPPVSDPVWSPDGTKIALIVNGDIFVMNANGTNQTNLSNTSGIVESNPSWSVTGKIVYERSGQIWMMNADGTNQTQFSGITQPSPAAPAFSSDGTQIAFVSNGEIWKINADGTNEQRVTTNASTDTHPAWSPDGTKIIFSKGGSGIAVINADGTNETNLTTVSGDVAPAWSPDGTTIAFRRAAVPGGLYLMDATGANQVIIIPDIPGTTGQSSNNPDWQPVPQTPNTFSISGRITLNNVGLSGVTVNLSGSTNATATTDAIGNYQFSGLAAGGNYSVSPSFVNHYFTPPNRSFSNLNGNRIADFTASGVCVGAVCAQNGKIAFSNSIDIFTMNSDGSNQTNLTNNPTFDTSPNYSPNGSEIVFRTNRDGNNEIYRMNADGSNPVRLTNNAASDTSPFYSPDGASIVFVSDRDGNNEIYKMNADGTNQVRLTNDPANDLIPAVSPNGQKIIFVTERIMPRRLFTMNFDGSNQAVISDVPGFYDRPSYSPDGSKIIFVYGDDVTTQAVWRMNADGTNRSQFALSRRGPKYSPDGTKIVFSSPFFNSQGIYTINADGNPDSSLRLTTQIDELPDWQPIAAPRRAQSDFDGDGRSDISVFRPSNGIWYLLRSSTGFSAVNWGIATDTPVPADYDGDLKTDPAIWRGSEGNFYVLNSFNNTVRVENFGLAGDVPFAGDWDADGKADLSVYRGGAQGTFYYRASMGNPNGNISFLPWGMSGDKPVANDFDGDGKTDAAVFRPSNGVWYVRQSTNGQLSANAFGLASDTLVPADYDADGKTDLAVYRAGIWYLLRSTQGFTAFQYGLAGDIPAPADYDGDGRADAAVYRNGIWYVLKSQSGTTEITSFGIGGDIPIPSAFVR